MHTPFSYLKALYCSSIFSRINVKYSICFFCLLITFFSLNGCAKTVIVNSDVLYTESTLSEEEIENNKADTKSEEKNENAISERGTSISRDFKFPIKDVWDSSLNHISSHYRINNIDMENGILRASFSSNTPNRIVDCGTQKDVATLPNGHLLTYSYKGADTPVFTVKKIQNTYMNNDRTLNLNGEILLFIEELSKNKTRITVQTKYTLIQNNELSDINAKPSTFSKSNEKIYTKETMVFYTGEKGSFQKNPDDTILQEVSTMQCSSNNLLENSILQIISDYLEK